MRLFRGKVTLVLFKYLNHFSNFSKYDNGTTASKIGLHKIFANATVFLELPLNHNRTKRSKCAVENEQWCDVYETLR